MLRDRPETTAAAASDADPDTRVRVPASRDEPEWPADDSRDAGASAARRHRQVLAASTIVLVLSFALVERPGGRVAVRGLTGYPLPQTCASRSLFGLNCPGCGLTRSFIHMAEGDWAASWRCHRLGGLMAVVVSFQVPYRLLALRRPDRPPIPIRWQGPVGLVLIALLILNWLVDVVTGRVASL